MEVMWWLCAVLLLLISITSCRQEAPVRMFSEKEYHYEERLSALSSDDSAYWVGTETGVIWHVSGEKRQRFDTGLDRIYDVERRTMNQRVTSHLPELQSRVARCYPQSLRMP